MKRLKTTKGAKHLGKVICFLLACFLFSIDASAQYYPPLVAPLQAQTMLSNEIPVLETRLGSLQPGTSEHEIAEQKLNMYMHAWEQLHVGDNVEDALTSAYGEFALDANGDQANLDEFRQLDRGITTYGDATFDDLVEFLEK